LHKNISFALSGFLFLYGLTVQAAGINIAAFGDSITRGYPYYTDDANGDISDTRNGGYIPELQAKLNVSDWSDGVSSTVYNWGIPGEHVVSSGQQRFPYPVLNKHPDYVLILEGTNDIGSGYYGSGHISNALNNIVLSVLADGGVPMIATVMPRYDANKSSEILDLNNLIRINAAATKTKVAELYSATANWPAKMQPDGLHPNLAGYELIADVWLDTLLAYKADLEAIERAKISGAQAGVNYLLLGD